MGKKSVPTIIRYLHISHWPMTLIKAYQHRYPIGVENDPECI